MAIALVVVQPFADYAKGDRITDAEKVAAALENNSHQVMKISGDAPEKDKTVKEPAR